MTIVNQRAIRFLLSLILIITSTIVYATNNPDNSSDYTIVVKDNSVVFDVLENDNITGNVKDFGIVAQPQYGTAHINDDQSITYAPEGGLCDEIDEFLYYIKDADGVDTVAVFVEILCESLTVISGFSPVAEEDPNTFTILGVENYPNNTLYIFNNDGNEIYYKEGYKNEWNGMAGGTLLPSDYVYYYVFNDGEGNMLSGYVQINKEPPSFIDD